MAYPSLSSIYPQRCELPLFALSEDHVGQRQTRLGDILRPVLGPSLRPNVQLRPTATTIVLFLNPRADIIDFRDARQKTSREGIFLNFYEEWRRDVARGLFIISKFYLTVVAEPEGLTPREIFALHSNSDIDVKAPTDWYRKAPHLHIGFSNSTAIHRAHIALCTGLIDTIFESPENFDAACSKLIEMLHHEILVRGNY